MRRFKSLHLAMLTLGSLCLNSAYASDTLHSLTDSEMSATTGQSLFTLQYLAPSDTGNSYNSTNGNIGFYKFGMEAELQLNANIKKLQLGCGGVNGANACDIDIDNVSLSGLGNSSTSNTDSDADRAARVGSSAILNNPFMQLAIKNPDSASTRQLVGVNFSAESIQGLLTFGEENSSTKNGINSLSGYMVTAATKGESNVNGFGTSLVSGEAARGTLNQSDGYDPITGKVCCLLFGAGTLDFETESYALNLRDKATGSNILKADLTLPEQVITGKRITSAALTANAKVRDIDLTGNIVAVAGGLITLDRELTGTLQNLNVDVAINENLGFFHKANLNGTAASLSVQSQKLQWPGNKSLAQTGWWLELSNPIDTGYIKTSQSVDIPKSTLNQTFGQVGSYLTDNPIFCGNNLASECLTGTTIASGNLNLINATRPQMTLTDLQLATQNFTPNCYGTLKFC
ncbi:hypothetical protein F884_02711 [Acinetobacter sp. CIP 102143]|uniref:hypothetical protein n=1 Tax=Acinetobacter sp. CIP 102143 TaxID=1144666 RepID=UPI0002D12F0C|nr:hypothetical protein [Acinetobacter sp. CIP 102143]ENX61651.1 hypothetical protein F884_02711 [Acinetobacter sp. CIP 102143]